MAMAAPLRIGLTGGLASGKSTVAARFASRGAALIDTDAIARTLTAAGGAAIAPIAAAFGAGLIGADGAMDRAAMRALVFADAAARLRLERLLHPLILQCSLQQAALAEAVAPLLVFEVPLLVEAPAVRAGLHLDRVLVIDCPPREQQARASARGRLAAEQIAAIIASQAPRAARLALADDVLVNAGPPGQLDAGVDRLWEAYTCAAATGL